MDSDHPPVDSDPPPAVPLPGRLGSNVSGESVLSPTPTAPDASKRHRSSTTSVFLNFINNGSQTTTKKPSRDKRLLSLYRLLVLELNLPGTSSAKLSNPENKEETRRAYEQLVSMVQIPFYLEKFIVFGLLVCLNSFLTLFTLVPLKIAIVTFSAGADYITSPTRDAAVFFRKLHFVKRDVITLVLILACVTFLASPTLEISRLYHDIRGQAHIKLYVMFGILEVSDKLLSSITQEIFTVLVGISLWDTSPRNLAKATLFLVFAFLFFACHSYVLIYQSVSLHVAANSYSNALLALLMSNQFAELKGAVFKKFEREGLFQVTMADLTERFQLSVMLFVIALRNLSQLSNTQLGLIPDSWKSWNKWFGAIFGPTVVVMSSEILVDWLKHCFINKFNRIRPRVYDNFLYVLSTDFMEVFSSNSKTYTSHEVSDYVLLTKRIGLPIISLTICFLRMSIRDLTTAFAPSAFTFSSVASSIILILLTFVALLVARLLLSLWLLNWARSIKHSHQRYQLSLQRQSIAEPDTPQSQGPSETVYSEPTIKLETPTIKSESITPPLEDITLKVTDEVDSVEPTDDYLASPFDSEIESSFIPGVPNTETSSINPTTRLYLYDYGEAVPPTPEEKRNATLNKKRSVQIPRVDSRTEDLGNVQRYEMASKRIW